MYLDRPSLPIAGLEWDPETFKNNESAFSPNIFLKEGIWMLEEYSDYHMPINKGDFIIKSYLGYEALKPETFHKLYVAVVDS